MVTILRKLYLRSSHPNPLSFFLHAQVTSTVARPLFVHWRAQICVTSTIQRVWEPANLMDTSATINTVHVWIDGAALLRAHRARFQRNRTAEEVCVSARNPHNYLLFTPHTGRSRCIRDRLDNNNTVTCTESGEYSPSQCDNEGCYCIDYRGQPMPGIKRCILSVRSIMKNVPHSWILD